MAKAEVRPSRLEDLEACQFEAVPVSARAWTGLLDGEPVALGGYWYAPTGHVFAFLNALPCVREKAKLALWKTAKMVLKDAKARGINTLYARANEDIDASERFLMRLGFMPTTVARIYIYEM